MTAAPQSTRQGLETSQYTSMDLLKLSQIYHAGTREPSQELGTADVCKNRLEINVTDQLDSNAVIAIKIRLAADYNPTLARRTFHGTSSRRLQQA